MSPASSSTSSSISSSSTSSPYQSASAGTSRGQTPVSLHCSATQDSYWWDCNQDIKPRTTAAADLAVTDTLEAPTSDLLELQEEVDGEEVLVVTATCMCPECELINLGDKLKISCSMKDCEGEEKVRLQLLRKIFNVGYYFCAVA